MTSLQVPEQFSSLFGMGTVEKVYKPKASLVFQIIVTVVLFGGAGVAVLAALWTLWNKWGVYYPPVIYKEMAIYLGVGAVVGFLGLLMVWTIFNTRKKALALYANGFAYSDRKGVQSWRWEQIDSITANVVKHYTNGVYTGTTHTYTLFGANSEKFVLNDTFKEVEEIYNVVQEKSFEQRYSRLAGAYNNGDTVVFGPVLISKANGIQIGKKVYPWTEIEKVGINKGVLSVKKKEGGWFSGASATAGSIPNLYVLLSIINQLVGLRSGK